MNDNAINNHYGLSDLSDRIRTALTSAGKNLNNLTREDIKTFDEFHIGGKQETLNLAELADLQPGKQLLDIGCGIGGPSRTLADEFKMNVSGIDLTHEFCNAANMLSKLVGLDHSTKFKQANALDTKFSDNSFDYIWMQHVGMNIQRKDDLLKEVQRVLKSGGKFIFHEILKSGSDQIHFPVFWASEQSLSFLIGEDDLKKLLTETGFHEVVWNDVSERSLNWFENVVESIKKNGPPKLGLGVIVENDVFAKASNIIRNLAEKKIRVVQAVFQAS